jgi:hypothetical protein
VFTLRQLGLEHLQGHDVDDEDPNGGVQQLRLVLLMNNMSTEEECSSTEPQLASLR